MGLKSCVVGRRRLVAAFHSAAERSEQEARVHDIYARFPVRLVQLLHEGGHEALRPTALQFIATLLPFPRSSPLPSYSYRSAVIGSSFAARNAG